VGQKSLRDGSGKADAIDGQRTSGRHLVRVRHPHDERIELAQLTMEHADSICLGIVGAKRIRADEFGQIRRTMGGRCAFGAHFVQNNRDPSSGDLPGRFRAGEAPANDMDRQ
jgi:hypothetical protein